MGMCKGCGKVFQASEMHDGFCKECVTPETLGKQKAQQSMADIKANNDYGTSIAISKFVSFIGWVAVLGGILFALLLIKEGGMALLGLSSAFTMALVGLILVIAGQSSRAVMDNANYSKAMLQLMIENKKE